VRRLVPYLLGETEFKEFKQDWFTFMDRSAMAQLDSCVPPSTSGHSHMQLKTDIRHFQKLNTELRKIFPTHKSTVCWDAELTYANLSIYGQHHYVYSLLLHLVEDDQPQSRLEWDGSVIYM
jgi:hypothetical protein